MSTYTIFVVTNEQDLDLNRFLPWSGALHFPMGDQACYGLQTHQESREQLLDKLLLLGYNAIWHQKLGAVVVVGPDKRLDEVGRRLVAELKSNGWPHGRVTQRSRKDFGVA